MAVKQTGRKIYKSMQGKQVDMDLLRQRNELTPAVGNAKVNARGDELGPGGKIIKKREEVLRDFYEDPFFKKVIDSQKAYAKRVMGYLNLNQPDYRMAYDHYFG